MTAFEHEYHLVSFKSFVSTNKLSVRPILCITMCSNDMNQNTDISTLQFYTNYPCSYTSSACRAMEQLSYNPILVPVPARYAGRYLARIGYSCTIFQKFASVHPYFQSLISLGFANAVSLVGCIIISQ